jgi:hypothetical protein
VKLNKDDRKLLAEGRLHAPGIITLLEKLFDDVCGLKKQLAKLQQTAQAHLSSGDQSRHRVQPITSVSWRVE